MHPATISPNGGPAPAPPFNLGSSSLNRAQNQRLPPQQQPHLQQYHLQQHRKQLQQVSHYPQLPHHNQQYGAPSPNSPAQHNYPQYSYPQQTYPQQHSHNHSIQRPAPSIWSSTDGNCQNPQLFASIESIAPQQLQHHLRQPQPQLNHQRQIFSSEQGSYSHPLQKYNIFTSDDQTHQSRANQQVQGPLPHKSTDLFVTNPRNQGHPHILPTLPPHRMNSQHMPHTTYSVPNRTLVNTGGPVVQLQPQHPPHPPMRGNDTPAQHSSLLGSDSQTIQRNQYTSPNQTAQSQQPFQSMTSSY